jgi:histidinol phosphatase-like enzyme
MNFKKNNVIKFNNGDYLILDILNYKENVYLYLINNSEYENDVSIVKVDNNSGIIKYSFIEDDEEFNYVINKLFLDRKIEISDFLE